MRVGTICYATEQGIGYLAKDFYDNGIITDVLIFRHGSRSTHLEWYPGAQELVGRPFTGLYVEKWLDKVDVLLQFETPFDWSFLTLAKKHGVKIALVPMYECTPAIVPVQPDRWLCPSKLDQEYFDGPFLPVPVKSEWNRRTVCEKFLHNGGNLGLRGHKGTLEILQAWKLCKQPINLTIRAQDTIGFAKLLAECGFGRTMISSKTFTFSESTDSGMKFLHVSFAPVPRSNLFDANFDCFVMAEKYNGLSLPISEARAAGMLVVTSDRFPMNDWLPRDPLIPVESYSRQKVGGPYNFYMEAKVLPEAIAAKLDSLHGTDISEYSLGGREYAEANSWSALKPLWTKELESML